MKIILWILGILAVLILLLCLTRVGVRAVLAENALAVDLKIWLFHIRIYPKKEKTEEKETPKDSSKDENKKKKLPQFRLEDVKDMIRTLWPPLKRALGRTRRGIRIAPMELSLTLGGMDDPAKTAELYGYLHAGMWNVMPALEKVLDIPGPHLHIGIDFNTPKTTIEGELGVTARIGTLLAVALGVGIPALRWFLRCQKNMKKQKPAPQPAA